MRILLRLWNSLYKVSGFAFNESFIAVLLVIQAIHRAPSGIVIISDCHMFASSDPEQMMMMMQGILPALDPDARLNLALSLSLQEGVSICKASHDTSIYHHTQYINTV